MAAESKSWSSIWLFIMAATASAVGLGNIWKFPYITGENGGGAFVLIYLLCVLFIGVPILIAEILIGRLGRKSPTSCFLSLAQLAKSNANWQFIGHIGMLTSFFLLSYYSVIAGLAANFLLKNLGVLFALSPIDFSTQYQVIVAQPAQLLLYSSLFLSLACAIVIRGVKNGLEALTRFLVPLLFIILLVIIVYNVVTTHEMLRTINYLFVPRFEDFTFESLLSAVGHAFFTLSIGTASMLIYGCYLKDNANLVHSALIVALFDTAVALLAGLAIFPIVFDQHIAPSAGPSLLFVSLPHAFINMPLGHLIGTLFFLLLLLAALGSAISMIEPITAWLMNKFDWSRKKSALLTSGSIWLLSLGSVASFSTTPLFNISIQINFYQHLDDFVSLVLLPLSGFLIAFYASWVLPRNISALGFAQSKKIHRLWYQTTRYLVVTVGIIIFGFSIQSLLAI